MFNSSFPSLNNVKISSNKNTIAVLSVSDGITTFLANSEPFVNEQKKNTINNLKPYPNPFSGSFYIKLDEKNIQPLELMLYDVNGKKIYSNNDLHINENNVLEINAQTVSNGIYFGKIVFAKMNYHFKVIKLNL